LFSNRQINLVMDNRPLCVEYDTTINIVSKLAMTRSIENLYDCIIITNNDSYYGIVTIKDLLEKTTQLEINYAKHLNPLTGLPGNIIIEHELEKHIGNNHEFSVLYLDIDNFKVYNDVYGFENGDKMIQFISRMLTESLSCYCNSQYFIGHIGGDDFIVIIDECIEQEKICEDIINKFKKRTKDFYKTEDFEKNHIIAKNRYGHEEQFGIVTISIAGVNGKDKNFKDIYQLSEYASQIKTKCKSIWDNCYIIE
jgi:diguanylate cyclase (GGDEF)-like protein